MVPDSSPLLAGLSGQLTAGGVPHDARPAERGLGAGLGVLPRIFREPRLPLRWPQAVPHARHQRCGCLGLVCIRANGCVGHAVG